MHQCLLHPRISFLQIKVFLSLAERLEAVQRSDLTGPRPIVDVHVHNTAHLRDWIPHLQIRVLSLFCLHVDAAI